MSCDIDTFKLKKLGNFKMPLESLFKHEREDWHPEKEWQEDGSLIVSGSESMKLQGTVNDKVFHCTNFFCYGEGSGTFMNWILEPAFKESSGILVASCVWEGGDSINQLRVKDGEVKWVDIEI